MGRRQPPPQPTYVPQPAPMVADRRPSRFPPIGVTLTIGAGAAGLSMARWHSPKVALWAAVAAVVVLLLVWVGALAKLIRTGVRRRDRLAPTYSAVALAGCATGAHALHRGLAAVAVVAVSAVAVCTWAHFRRSAHTRNIIIDCALVAVGWTTWVALAGMSAAAALVWLVAVVGAQVWQWRRWRARPGPEVPMDDRIRVVEGALPPTPDRLVVYQDLLDGWDRIAEDAGTPGAGIEYIEHHSDNFGRSRLDAGSGNLAKELQAARPHLESAILGEATAHGASLVVEAHGIRHAYMDITFRDPLADAQPWSAVEHYGTGSILDPLPVGVYDDGTSEIDNLYDAEHGARHSNAVGKPGSGKSGWMNLRATKGISARDALVIGIDMKGGQEFRPLIPGLFWLATNLDMAHLVLYCVKRLVDIRGATAPTKTWRPGIDGPAVLVALDEAKELYVGHGERWQIQECLTLSESIRARGRSTGVGFHASGIYGTAEACWGSVLMLEGVDTAACFRTKGSGEINRVLANHHGMDASLLRRAGEHFVEFGAASRSRRARALRMTDADVAAVVDMFRDRQPDLEPAGEQAIRDAAADWIKTMTTDHGSRDARKRADLNIYLPPSFTSVATSAASAATPDRDMVHYQEVDDDMDDSHMVWTPAPTTATPLPHSPPEPLVREERRDMFDLGPSPSLSDVGDDPAVAKILNLPEQPRMTAEEAMVVIAAMLDEAGADGVGTAEMMRRTGFKRRSTQIQVGSLRDVHNRAPESSGGGPKTRWRWQQDTAVGYGE